MPAHASVTPTARRTSRRRDATTVPSAAALLKQVGEVELATSAQSLDELGDERAYLFELKYDGYRVLAAKVGDDVRLESRNRRDWTTRFELIAAAVRALPVGVCLLDGEMCVVDAAGVPSFERLQRWASANRREHEDRDARLSFAVFDLLHVDGRDVRALPLERRRALLASILPERAGRAGRADRRAGDAGRSPIVLSSALEAGPVARDGDPFASARSMLRAVCAAGLEGLLAKRRGSPYREGRTRDWLKLKCARRQELAILGYVPQQGTSHTLGALLLGVADGAGGFAYAGEVGTGFDARTARDLAARLDAARVAAPTAQGAPHDARARWSTPELVAEISLTEWTAEGRARHPVFLGLREDRAAATCVREGVLLPAGVGAAERPTRDGARTSGRRGAR